MERLGTIHQVAACCFAFHSEDYRSIFQDRCIKCSGQTRSFASTWPIITQKMVFKDKEMLALLSKITVFVHDGLISLLWIPPLHNPSNLFHMWKILEVNLSLYKQLNSTYIQLKQLESIVADCMNYMYSLYSRQRISSSFMVPYRFTGPWASDA